MLAKWKPLTHFTDITCGSGLASLDQN